MEDNTKKENVNITVFEPVDKEEVKTRIFEIRGHSKLCLCHIFLLSVLLNVFT